jgi:hypothetical protein
MHEEHECHDDVASKPKRSRYLGAQCIQDLKEVKERKHPCLAGVVEEGRHAHNGI